MSPPQSRPTPRSIAEFLTPGSGPWAIAHRGFSGQAPENTLAAFALAIEFGAPMIEFDVTLTRDGEVVVIHDDTLNRTTTGRGPVAAQTLAELRRLDAGSWFSPKYAGERIPTLEETLALIGERALVNIEIKEEAVAPGAPEGEDTGVEARVIQIVRAAGAHQPARSVISSFEPRALERVRLRAPDLAIAALYNQKLQRGMAPGDILRATGAGCFNLSRTEVTPEIVSACRDCGAPVLVYTVNDPAEFRRLAEMGAHGVFTDKLDMIQSEIERLV